MINPNTFNYVTDILLKLYIELLFLKVKTTIILLLSYHTLVRFTTKTRVKNSCRFLPKLSKICKVCNLCSGIVYTNLVLNPTRGLQEGASECNFLDKSLRASRLGEYSAVTCV